MGFPAYREGDLLKLNAVELMDWVGQVTLAEISKQPDYVLKEIGWYDSGARKELYGLGSTGVWYKIADSTLPVQGQIRNYLGEISGRVDTSVAGTGIARIVGERMTEARMGVLDTALSTLDGRIDGIEGLLTALNAIFSDVYVPADHVLKVRQTP